MKNALEFSWKTTYHSPPLITDKAYDRTSFGYAVPSSSIRIPWETGWSMSVWFRLNQHPSYTSSNPLYYIINRGAGAFYPAFDTDEDLELKFRHDQHYYNNQNTLEIGRWYHLFYKKNANTPYYQVYIDKSSWMSGSIDHDSYYSDFIIANLGGYYSSYYNNVTRKPFHGTIREIAIWEGTSGNLLEDSYDTKGYGDELAVTNPKHWFRMGIDDPLANGSVINSGQGTQSLKLIGNVQKVFEPTPNYVDSLAVLTDKASNHNIGFTPAAIVDHKYGLKGVKNYGTAVGSSNGSDLANKNQTWVMVGKATYAKTLLDSLASYGYRYEPGIWDLRVRGTTGIGYTADLSKPADYIAGFGEPIIALQEMVLGNGEPNTFPAGYIFHGAGGGANNTLQRMEDPANPRHKPYDVSNQNTGTWSWKTIATTRGVEWDFAKEIDVENDLSAEASDRIIAVTTDNEWAIISLEFDRELMLFNVYKNGLLIGNQFFYDEQLRNSQDINIFSNVSKSAKLNGSFGELLIMPRINTQDRQAIEYYLSEKWSINRDAYIQEPAIGYSGSSSGEWQGDRVPPMVIPSDPTYLTLDNRGMIKDKSNCYGHYRLVNKTSNTSIMNLYTPSDYAGEYYAAGWYAEHIEDSRSKIFWEIRVQTSGSGDFNQSQSKIWQIVIGWVGHWGFNFGFYKEDWTYYKGTHFQYESLMDTTYSTVTPDEVYEALPSELPQEFFDGALNGTYDQQNDLDVWLVDPIHEEFKGIDWVQNNANNRIFIIVDGTEEEYQWERDEDDLILTDVFGTHHRRSYNGNLCILSQKYPIGGAPSGLEVDGLRGFFNTDTGKIDIYARGSTTEGYNGDIRLEINDDDPSNVKAICSDVLDPSNVELDISPLEVDQIEIVELTPLQAHPVEAVNLFPARPSNILLNVSPEPISDLAITQEYDFGENFVMLQVPQGTNDLGSGNAGTTPYTFTHDNDTTFMGKYEVTQQLYYDVMGLGTPPDPNRPMDNIRLSDAMIFAQQLTTREQITGKLPLNYVYYVPNHRLWEYVCRSGTTGDWGIERAVAGETLACRTNNVYGGVLRDVGSFDPNFWGFHDMHGNVRELTTTAPYWYTTVGASYTSQARGGSYDDFIQQCYSYYDLDDADEVVYKQGVRLALKRIYDVNSAPVPTTGVYSWKLAPESLVLWQGDAYDDFLSAGVPSAVKESVYGKWAYINNDKSRIEVYTEANDGSDFYGFGRLGVDHSKKPTTGDLVQILDIYPTGSLGGDQFYKIYVPPRPGRDWQGRIFWIARAYWISTATSVATDEKIWDPANLYVEG